MPQRPYLPRGSMRAAITYPDPPEAFSRAEVEAVVKRMGLTDFLPALDEVSQRRVMSIFDNELNGATLVSIGHRPGLEHFHTRVLRLVRTPQGPRLDHTPLLKPAPIRIWPLDHAVESAARRGERGGRLSRQAFHAARGGGKN